MAKRATSVAVLAHRDALAPRVTHSLEDSWDRYRETRSAFEGNKIRVGDARAMNEGRTCTSRSFHQMRELEEVMARFDFDPVVRVTGWKDMSIPERIDMFTTWLIGMDAVAQSIEYTRNGEVLSAYQMYSRQRREIPFSPETIEWLHVTLGHVVLLWGAASPASSGGINHHWYYAQVEIAEDKRLRKEERERTRALTHRRIEGAIETRTRRSS